MRVPVLSIVAVLTLALGACDPGTSSSGTDGGTTGGTPTTGSNPTTSPPTTGIGSSSETSGVNPSGSVTTDGLPPGSGCCEPHEGPGCDEAAVQTCVCDMDASCCGFDWRQDCVNLAQARCEATCVPDMTTSDATSGSTGFGDTTGFGTFGSSGFGSSGFGSSTGGGGGFLCCYEGAGCDHLPTEQCVCDIDPSCCDGEWTPECVDIATTSCNACTSDDCCTPQTDAGCADVQVQDCVCNIDPYCCDTEWDYICIEIAESDCKACAG